MELTLEQVEKVRQYAGVSFEEARNALEQTGGSALDAVILLERQGKAPRGDGGAWSTRYGAPQEEQSSPGPSAARADLPAKPWAKTRAKSNRRRISGEEVGEAIKSLLRNCTRITIDVWRRDDLLVGIPLIICVLLFIIAPYVMIPLTILGLVLRCRYHISGWDFGAETINRTMDQVTDTVAGWTEQIKAEIKSEMEAEKRKKHDQQKK